MTISELQIRRPGNVAATVAPVPTHIFDFLGRIFIAFPGNVPQGVADRMEVIAVYGEALRRFSPEIIAEAYRRFLLPGFHKHAPFRPDLPRCIEVCLKIVAEAQVEKDAAEFNAMLAKERAEKERRNAEKVAADKAERAAMEAEWDRNRIALETRKEGVRYEPL